MIQGIKNFDYQGFEDYLNLKAIKPSELSQKIGYSRTYLRNIIRYHGNVRTVVYKSILAELGLPEGTFIIKPEPQKELVVNKQIDRIEVQLDRLERKVDRLTMLVENLVHELH